jgi:hypothetical protein
METSRDPKVPGVANNSDSIEERKLWLDYLRSLNERRLQATQRSGWTNRVLLAVLAGLLYQFVPRLPMLFATTGAVAASLVSIMLATDALAYFLLADALLLYYCAGGTEHRVMPEPRRRSANVTMWIFLPLGTAFSILQVWIGVSSDLPSHFVKWSVVILGVWWGLNLLWGAKKQIHAARRARVQRIPLPQFTASIFSPDWESLVAVGFLLSVALFASITLVVYLKELHTDWVVPLGAASVFLTSFAICWVLIYRGLSLTSEGTYDILERDILLDQLDAKEIRSRFVRDTLGADTTAWLDELLAGLKAEDDNLIGVRDSAQKRLEEINTIAPEYSTERNARARKVLDELETAMQRHKSRLENLQFQMDLFLKSHKTQREREVLHRWVGDLKRRTEESVRIISTVRELVGHVNQIN